MPPTFSSKPLPFSGKTSTAIPHWNELQYNSTISYTRSKKYIQTLVSMEFLLHLESQDEAEGIKMATQIFTLTKTKEITT